VQVKPRARVGAIAACAALALGVDHGTERSTIDKIVIHTIGGPSCSDAGEVVFRPVRKDAKFWRKWLEKEQGKGIHYVVDREGVALASIPEQQIAPHVVGHNKTSIGIELVNNGDGVDPFPAAQIDALVTLLCDIAARNSLGASDIKAHADLDKKTKICGGKEYRRRVDPGALFPWQDVLERVETCLAEGGVRAGVTASDETAGDVSVDDAAESGAPVDDAAESD
jgi:N-acetylmuramoyl-L-alanine amidase